MNKKIKSKSIFYTILAILLIVWVSSVFLVFAWTFATTFRHKIDFELFGALDFTSGPLTFKNWALVFTDFYAEVAVAGSGSVKFFIEDMLINTALYSLGSTLAFIIALTLMAYVVGRFPNKVSTFLQALCIITMSLPIVGSLPSEIAMAKSLNIYGTMWGLWIMAFNYNGFYFLILSQSFKSIPKDFADSASIDGAGRFRIMLSIMLPMVKNVIGTIALIKFVEVWNNYQTPLIYIPEHPTLMYGFMMLTLSPPKGVPDFYALPARFSVCIVVALPIVVLFTAFNKKFLGNLSMGGLKE